LASKLSYVPLLRRFLSQQPSKMNWKCKDIDETGWQGTRKYAAEDFARNEEVVNTILPRMGGMEALELRATEINEVCAEYTTPFTTMLWHNGKPAIKLQKRLQKLMKEWSEKDKDIGLSWRIIVFGLEQFSSPCSAALKGDQPEFWVHLEWLSDRLLRENEEYRRKKAQEEDLLTAKTV